MEAIKHNDLWELSSKRIKDNWSKMNTQCKKEC